jgi:hypothetical protein
VVLKGFHRISPLSICGHMFKYARFVVSFTIQLAWKSVFFSALEKEGKEIAGKEIK